jgi:hypothetical protein
MWSGHGPPTLFQRILFRSQTVVAGQLYTLGYGIHQLQEEIIKQQINNISIDYDENSPKISAATALNGGIGGT